MRKSGPVLALVGFAAFLAVRTPSQQGTPAAPAGRIALLADFGLTAKVEQRWDGKALLTNATLVSIEGRHLSEGDGVKPDGSWTAVTRRDAVAPYADLHYTEMRPGSTPEVLHKPVGVYLTVDPQPGARVTLETARGKFDFDIAALSGEPTPFAGGAGSIRLVPPVERLSGPEYEDDEPSIAALPNGNVAVAWVAYKGEADRVLVRTRAGELWSAPEEVTPKPADVFRASVAATADGALHVFWSQRDNERLVLWMARKSGGKWSPPVAVNATGSATFHRAAAWGSNAFVAYQSFVNGQSDIYLAQWNGQTMQNFKMSESSANDWEPQVAAGADGSAHVVWDGYDKGNYDVFHRSIRNATPGPVAAVTSGPEFQAHASVAVDDRGRPWVAWDESGVNWGKDQGFLLPTPLATPLHQRRWTRVAMLDGAGWRAPKASPPSMEYNAEHPHLAFSGTGALTMVFRHWTRRLSRSIGSSIVWENYVTAFDGARWTSPQPVPNSGGWIEKPALVTRDPKGALWAAWMTDNRPFTSTIPGNSDVLAAKLPAGPNGAIGAESTEPFREPLTEEIPVHNTEESDVRAIRSYTILAGPKKYKIYRGDMHRHTDISQDFKYDGSLFEVYRYALDAAGFDYLAPTDHQTGYDQEFSWWQNQKYVDLFLVPGRFVPLFGYERSLKYPNGHRNIIWSYRGVRTLPIPADEAAGEVGAKKLFEHLRATKGISMPHSSATAQGTDWRDNDPEVEPLVEIYQGYRASYEYEGAPKAATELNQHAQKSGWQPQGFYWNALAKGYKLGVQASSDHWSTHISYACIIAEQPTREGLVDAMRKRHAYAATDNIVLDFRARDGASEYIQGDAFDAQSNPKFYLQTSGTATIKQIDLISNKRFLYTSRPAAKSTSFEFTDRNPPPGESWYYARVMQEDGQIAWSSPIWVKR